MNVFDKNMKDRKEGEPNAISAVKIGCMDENDRVGWDVIKIGIAGSGVTRTEGGDETLYPYIDRENISKASVYIFGWVKKFSKDHKVHSYASDHPECGAAGAQGFTEGETTDNTRMLSDENKVEYTGRLVISKAPVNTPNSTLLSWFNRERGEPHRAAKVIVTVGGGIKGEEKEKLENESGQGAFDISADWVKYALENGLDADVAIRVLVFQFRLAYAIAGGVRNNPEPFGIFDGKRLVAAETSENRVIAEEAITIAKQQIAQGNWKAASHH